MKATERKTATLLEPLTMDRQEGGSFDASTYCEDWLYEDAVCPVKDTICLCTACRVSDRALSAQTETTTLSDWSM